MPCDTCTHSGQPLASDPSQGTRRSTSRLRRLPLFQLFPSPPPPTHPTEALRGFISAPGALTQPGRPLSQTTTQPKRYEIPLPAGEGRPPPDPLAPKRRGRLPNPAGGAPPLAPPKRPSSQPGPGAPWAAGLPLPRRSSPPLRPRSLLLLLLRQRGRLGRGTLSDVPSWCAHLPVARSCLASPPPPPRSEPGSPLASCLPASPGWPLARSLLLLPLLLPQSLRARTWRRRLLWQRRKRNWWRRHGTHRAPEAQPRPAARSLGETQALPGGDAAFPARGDGARREPRPAAPLLASD